MPAGQYQESPHPKHADKISGRLLYAFYDLEFSPTTFDFLTWLLQAELCRREKECDGIHIVFVPGCEHVVNPDRYLPWVARWRIDTVCIPACKLLPSVAAITMCASREAAGEIEDASGGFCFPVEYTTRLYQSTEVYETARMAMVESWILGSLVVRHLLGDEIPVLRATTRAACFIRDWLGPRSVGRRVIVITLRESRHDPTRNANLEEWLKFAHSLDREIYFPVIVRDTEQVFRAPAEDLGIATCTAASLDVDIRTALYETAYLNLMVNNGPLMLCVMNPAIPYIAYRYFSCSDEYGVIPYGQAYGISTGGSYAFANDLQRVVWDMDNFPVIAATFEEMVARIEASDVKCPREMRERRRGHAREELLTIAMGFHITNLHPIAETLYQFLVDANPEDAAPQAMLGLLKHHRGDDEAALLLLSQAIGRHRDVAGFFFNLGVILKKLGRLDDSLSAFVACLKLEGEPSAAVLANLGAIYRRLGRRDDAIMSYRDAVARGARDCETLFEYASSLKEAEQSVEACEAFALLRNQYIRNATSYDEQVVRSSPALAPLTGIRSPHYVSPMTHERRHLWSDEW